MGVETKVPQLPRVTIKDNPELQRLMDAVIQTMEVREGRRGDKLDKAITYRDLMGVGLAKFRPTGGGGAPVVGTFPPGTEFYPSLPVVATPPAVEGLTVSSGVGMVFVDWGQGWLVFENYSYAKVYRSLTNDFGAAILLGSSDGGIYVDEDVTAGFTYYYWVTYVTTENVEGPINATAGTAGAPVEDPARLIELLGDGVAGSTPFLHLDTPTVINGVTVPAGTYMRSTWIHDAAITNAKIRNAAITSAKIGTGEIKNANIDNAAITSAKIGSGEIKTANIGLAQITNARIGNAAITSAKIGDAEVDTLQIKGGAVSATETHTGAVTTLTAKGLTSLNGGGGLNAAATPESHGWTWLGSKGIYVPNTIASGTVVLVYAQMQVQNATQSLDLTTLGFKEYVDEISRNAPAGGTVQPPDPHGMTRVEDGGGLFSDRANVPGRFALGCTFRATGVADQIRWSMNWGDAIQGMTLLAFFPVVGGRTYSARFRCWNGTDHASRGWVRDYMHLAVR